MNISVVVYSPPTAQAARTAFLYTEAALAQGHHIYRLFFYHDGVLNGSQLSQPPQDEFNLPVAWQQLIENRGLDAVVCVSSALRRGILNVAEAERYDKTCHNLAEPYEISGLGQLVDACLQSDRVIGFGE
ncbi:MAG: sulfurtransferase complex subunit TusD [Pseudomonadales bacterium]|nr:sulfurtransferase complex subunit TusD [Pseudomonadales bacterium]